MPAHLPTSISTFPLSSAARHRHSGLAGTSALSIWLSVDPMSDKYPGTSPYTYCANNPVMIKDPNGESGVPVVDEKNRTITVYSKLYFYGSGATPELSKKIATGIASQWNGANAEVKIDGIEYSVRFRISYETVSVEKARKLAATNKDPKNNFICIARGPKEKSSFARTSKYNGVRVGGNSFWFNTNDDLENSTTPAHEFGHGFGLSHPNEDLSEATERPDIMVPRNRPYGKNWSVKNKKGIRVVNPNSRRVSAKNVQEAADHNFGKPNNIIFNNDGSH